MNIDTFIFTIFIFKALNMLYLFVDIAVIFFTLAGFMISEHNRNKLQF